MFTIARRFLTDDHGQGAHLLELVLRGFVDVLAQVDAHHAQSKGNACQRHLP